MFESNSLMLLLFVFEQESVSLHVVFFFVPGQQTGADGDRCWESTEGCTGSVRGVFSVLEAAFCDAFGQSKFQARHPGLRKWKPKKDVLHCFQSLYQAGEKRWGTDESQFNAILASQSFEQLRLVFAEYQKLSKRSMEQVIKNEFSGDIERGLLTIGKLSFFVDSH